MKRICEEERADTLSQIHLGCTSPGSIPHHGRISEQLCDCGRYRVIVWRLIIQSSEFRTLVAFWLTTIAFQPSDRVGTTVTCPWQPPSQRFRSLSYSCALVYCLANEYFAASNAKALGPGINRPRQSSARQNGGGTGSQQMNGIGIEGGETRREAEGGRREAEEAGGGGRRWEEAAAAAAAEAAEVEEDEN